MRRPRLRASRPRNLRPRGQRSQREARWKWTGAPQHRVGRGETRLRPRRDVVAVEGAEADLGPVAESTPTGAESLLEIPAERRAHPPVRFDLHHAELVVQAIQRQRREVARHELKKSGDLLRSAGNPNRVISVSTEPLIRRADCASEPWIARCSTTWLIPRLCSDSSTMPEPNARHPRSGPGYQSRVDGEGRDAVDFLPVHGVFFHRLSLVVDDLR